MIYQQQRSVIKQIEFLILVFFLKVLGVSVLFRQTNIIWSGFVAGTVVLCQIEPIINDRLKKKGMTFFDIVILLYADQVLCHP